jgi:hypothetical protein
LEPNKEEHEQEDDCPLHDLLSVNVDAEQHYQIVQHASIFRSSVAARFGSMRIALVLPARLWIGT